MNGKTVMRTPHMLALVFGLTLAGAGLAQTTDITDAPGTIREVNAANGWYAIVPDADRATRYAPDRLPDDYRTDGLRVIFSSANHT